ncbi:MAG TPA: TonB-dependent receptor [Verrucomicrobiae bacterium]|nr:TonB-dependent receptor [Verrucomicrobiae bacterium]
MRVRIALGFVLLFVVGASAQTFRGTILGTVTDATGAVVAGAKVNVKNTATGLQRSTETSADGSYSVPELPIGTYSVTVTQAGFHTFLATGVRVDVASERRVDAVLKPGEVSTQVEVAGELLPQVETTSAELGGTLTSETIETLPVNGRDYQKLIYLNPGIAGSPDQISDSPGSYGTFSMNGSRGRSNNFLLDGTDMNDGYRNDPAINEAGVFGDPATILPIDAVAELRVLSNYEAEYGRNSGAVINIVTKSGTDRWHGSAIEYYRSGKVGARNYFNFAPDPKSPFNNDQFGGSLGGPIVKDKTFFYADYEGQRENGGQAGTTCVPDPQQIAADQTALGATNPVIAALLARNPWPTPNIASAAPQPGQTLGPGTDFDTGCPNGDNLSTSTSFFNRVDSLITKIDHNFNTNNMLTGRYYFGDSNQSFPFAQLSGGLLPGFNTVTPTRVQLVALSWVRVMNASQVNEARLGWNRFAEGFFPQDQSFNPNSIGLDTGVGAYDGGLPATGVAGFSQIGATSSIPRNRVDSNWHFVDNYSWKSGKHDVKFGYEFRRTTIMQVIDHNFRGTLGFDNLSDFLSGISDGGAQVSGDSRRHTFQNSHAFFLQDEYRATPRLTLHYGLRWDYFGVTGENSGLFYTFDPANGGDNVPTSQLYGKDLNNFAPRLAFDYDLTGKGQTVVRGGWGLFYDAFSQDMFLGHLPWNCVFCPGPAYPGLGPQALQTGTVDTDPVTGLAVTPLAAGAPVYTNPGPEGDFFAVDPHMRTPYVQNFNLNVQQQVGSRTVVQIGYVGAKGTKLFQFLDINQPSQAQITAADLACVPDILAGDYCPAGYGVPRTFAPNFFYLNQERSSANSIYNALQASIRTSGWHGLSSQANFVWSHSIDTASDLEDFEPNEAQPQNSTNPAGDRGNSSFDIRRRFTWNFVYQFPKRKGQFAKLTDGWGIDGILNLQDGQPWHLNYEFEGDYSGAGEGFDRPDVVGPIHYSSNPAQYLDLSAFAAPCTWGNPLNDGTSDETNCVPGTRHFGNLGRNSLRGPSFKEFNFSLFKDTFLSERVNLQLRAEFFNLLNHPNFSNPLLPNFIGDIGAPNPATGGYVFSGVPSYYSLTATGDVGIGNPFLGGGGPRGIQFAAILKF